MIDLQQSERPHDASLAAEAVELRLEDGRALLEDISLRLEPGSLNVLVGPPGPARAACWRCSGGSTTSMPGVSCWVAWISAG